MKKYLLFTLNILTIAAFFALAYLVVNIGVNTYLQIDKTAVIALCVAGILLSVFLVPLVHELGHLVLGLVNQMSFYSLRVGFVVFYRQGGKIKLRLSGSSDYLGDCQMIPKNSKNLYRRFLFMAAGGNLFTFFYLLLTVILFIFRQSISPYVYFFVVAALPVAFYLLCVNIFGGEGRTDGSVIYGLIKKDQNARATVNILGIQSNFFSGKTPSEIDKDLYFNIEPPSDYYLQAVILNLQYVYYRDSENDQMAYATAIKLEDIAPNLDERTAQNVLCDALYERMLKGEDVAALYTKTQKFLHLENTATNLRIRAAYAIICKNDIDGARRLVLLAQDECKKTVILGLARFEEKILITLKDKIQKSAELKELQEKQKSIDSTRIFKR